MHIDSTINFGASLQGNLLPVSLRDQAIDVLHAATAIYTQEPVVDELLDDVDWPRDNRRLVDPSCGDGAFLGRALQRILKQRPNIDATSLLEVLEGWELHPVAVAESRARVSSLLTGHGWAIGNAMATAKTLVRHSDFLTDGPSTPCYHVIAANPPYLRSTNVPALLRNEYQALLPRYASTDLLHGFLDRCAALLHPDGEIALVSSDRWLFNSGTAMLRTVLGQSLGIHHLRRLDAKTSFYRPKQRRKGSPPRVHPVAIILRAPTPGCIPLTEAAIYPDRPETANGATQLLEDVAEVRLAPWLGAPGIFVVDQEVAHGLPAECLVPAVDARDIRDGQLLPPRRFALRTRPDQEPPPAVMAHLAANMHRMAPRGRRPQLWTPPESWHQWNLEQPSLLVPRIARTLRPVRVPPGTLPMDHHLRITATNRATLEQIEDALCCEDALQWMKAHAAPLENGYFFLGAKLLRRLPVALHNNHRAIEQ